MQKFWKPVITLVVALPMIAYVAGALSAATPEPRRYEAIVLKPAHGTPISASASATTSPKGQRDDATKEITPRPDDLDDKSDDVRHDNDGSSGPTQGPKNSDSSGPGSNGSGSNGSGGLSGDDSDDDDDKSRDDERDKSGDEDNGDGSGSNDDGDDDRSGTDPGGNSGSGSGGSGGNDDDSEPDDD